jgi:hypothetical protein
MARERRIRLKIRVFKVYLGLEAKMKVKPNHVALETYHANSDGVAWYAYYPAEGELDFSQAAIQEAIDGSGEPLGLDELEPIPEQV